MGPAASFVDTSALVALLGMEPEATRLATALEQTRAG